MPKKTKYVLKRVLPVACILGLLQFLFTSVLPRQFEMGIPPAVLITTSSFFFNGQRSCMCFLVDFPGEET